MTVVSLAPPGPRQSGSTLGKYQLIASLGQGGMAKVYLALVAGPASVNKLMVVKVLKNDVLQGIDGGLDQFWDEARLATRLLHPNIVHTYEVGEIDGHHFLAMEYLDGQVYRVVQARAADARLPLCEELRILAEVARGLHHAHEVTDYRGVPLGVVHRDISPQNVFVTYQGQVKLIDFGIAKTHDASHETRVGLIKGKLNYIAPEQLRGEALDRRADIFALGVMLWEAVAGKRFTAHNTEVAKVHARITGDEPKIRDVRPDVPEALAQIIERATALDREQRYADAAGFADAVEAYIESTGEHPSTKSLAARMETLFEQDHTAMRKVIDARVQAILERTSDEILNDIPSLPTVDEAHTGSGSLATSGTRSRREESQPPEVTGIRQAWAALGKPLQRGLTFGGALLAVGAAAFVLLSPAPPRATPAETTQPTARDEESTPHRAPPAPTEAPKVVHLKLTVSPEGARVTIDGAHVATPFSGSFTEGSTLHRIEATAEGHRPYARLMAFDQDHTLTVKLEPAPTASIDDTRKGGASRSRSGADRHSGAVVSPQPEPHVASDEPKRPAVYAPGADIPTHADSPVRGDIDTTNPYATKR